MLKNAGCIYEVKIEGYTLAIGTYFLKIKEEMHRRGLEPPTTRFEAGYSIH